jgi:prepilin-type N-terminal cleavage/methylation domain-containing protein/prepilin-type processing-associated H-X9-DG protein
MPKRLSRGFTLVELLVVVAVIAVLAAIIFPVLSRARSRSHATVCTSNLRQFGTAFALYSDDWDQRFPSPGGHETYLTAWDHNSGETINRYISPGKREPSDRAGIWLCPAYMQKAPYLRSEYPPRSYGMNSYLRGAQADNEYPGWPSYPRYPAANADTACWERGIHLSQIRDPAKTILLYEGTYNLSTGYVGRPGGMNQVMGFWDVPQNANERAWSEGWHNGRNIYLWCDGHVAAMRPETRSDFPTGQPTYLRNNWYAMRYR